MKPEVLKNEEKQMNMIIFLTMLVVPVAAFTFVMLFLQGTAIDALVFLMAGFAILIKLFEKKLGAFAKYLYISIMPIISVIIIAGANDGKFGAITHSCFLILTMSIAYYDKTVVLVNAIETVVLNAAAMLFFTDAYLLYHNLPVWIFIMIVYFLAAATAYVIAGRTYNLFVTVEAKETDMVQLLDNVKSAFENLESSSSNINSSLSSVGNLSQKIAESTTEIADNAEVQTQEVAGSQEIFNELAEMITSSETRVGQTIENINTLQKNNDVGIASINELSKKFDENIKSTQEASEEVALLSEKSNLIGNIIDSIHQIAQQTNLLALNAAIEAARAGEAGKGFAVVADEINKLSQQSADSTQKIDEILKDIIGIVEHAGKTMDHNTSIVKVSHDKLNATIGIFNNILDSSKEVKHITDLLEEELKGIVSIKDRLMDSMNKLSEISQKSANSSADIKNSTMDQVTAIEDIIGAMDVVQQGIEHLSNALSAGEQEN
ncbi:MAG: chemotaxis protein [Lachnospiraceae bacterium]|nr:chemotaxis protein [Lachnospiraceae bacterium]